MARIVKQRVDAALPIGIKPSLDGGTGAPHRLGDLGQSQFTCQAKADSQQPLTPGAGRFRFKAADDQISLAATIKFCSGSCHPSSLTTFPNLYQTIYVVGIIPQTKTDKLTHKRLDSSSDS